MCSFCIVTGLQNEPSEDSIPTLFSDFSCLKRPDHFWLSTSIVLHKYRSSCPGLALSGHEVHRLDLSNITVNPLAPELCFFKFSTPCI